MQEQGTRNRRRERESTQRNLNRTTDSVTVSLTRDDGQRFTKVGYGVGHAQRVLDAYAQLPPGEYVVDTVSSPSTIYSDVSSRERVIQDVPHHRTTTPVARYEGKRVSISP